MRPSTTASGARTGVRGRRDASPRAVVGLLVVLSVCAAVGARADSLDARFERAVAALDADDPSTARRELLALVELGVEDPDVYLNLGLAEAESMRYGHAMVAFERALSLRPNDEVAAQGLELASRLADERQAHRVGVARSDDRRGLLVRLGRAVAEPVSAGLTLVGAWLLGLALTALAFVRTETTRIAAAVIAVVGGLLGLAGGLALVGRARPAGVTPAIVVHDTEARSAPHPGADVVGRFAEGARVDVLGTSLDHARIAVDGRPRGYVPRRHIGTY